MAIRLALLLALVGGSGCYSYRVTTLDAIEEGTPVRVRVTPQEAERIAELRMSEERVVPGTVLRRADDVLLLETPVVGSDARQLAGTLTQRIEIPNDAIREVELRQLDRLRTGALIGAVAGAVGYVLVSQLDGGRADDDTPPGGNPERVRPPRLLFAIPLRF